MAAVEARMFVLSADFLNRLFNGIKEFRCGARAYVTNFDGKLWNIVCKYVEYVDKGCGEDLMIVKGDF